MTSFLSYIAENAGAIGMRTLEHLLIVLAALVPAVAFGTAAAVFLSRPSLQPFRGPGFYLIGLGQTIPSLAILALAVGLIGIGTLPAVIGIFLYILFPVARNAFTGLRSVPAAALDAARGTGMTDRQLLRHIELPLAAPFILAGIRTATVYGISAAALAYLTGGGGLGDFIFTGISLYKPEAMLAGAIPTAALALAADAVLGRTQRRAERWRTPREDPGDAREALR